MLKLALAPWLLWQGRRVRRTATRLPEAAGERLGTITSATDLTSGVRLLILGDSSAAGVGVAQQRDALAGQVSVALAARSGRTVHWHLVARSGLATPGAVALWREAGAPAADVAVVVTGVNDVTEQLSPSRVRRERNALQAALRTEAGVRHVVYTPVPPMQAFTALPQPLRWVLGRDAQAHGRALARWAQAGDASRSLLDLTLPLDAALLADDGFHPGAEVYRRWGEALAEHLNARLD